MNINRTFENSYHDSHNGQSQARAIGCGSLLRKKTSSVFATVAQEWLVPIGKCVVRRRKE